MKTHINPKFLLENLVKMCIGYRWLTSFVELNVVITRILRSEGMPHTTLRLKTCYQLCTKYIAGEPVMRVSRPRIGIDQDGLPKLLPKELRQAIKDNRRVVIRLILTALSCYRLWRWRTVADTSTITSVGPLYDREFWVPLVKQVRGLLHRPDLTKENLQFRRYHLTNKMGPNGHALVSAHLDLLALRNKPVRNHLLDWCMALQDTYHFFLLLRLPSEENEKWAAKALRPLVTGRLGHKDDPAGKARLFGITDYWTQTLLRPLHNSIARVLQTIEEDATFNQERGAMKVRELTRVHHELYSLDLSAATDRMPALLQADVLQSLLPADLEKLSSIWRLILTDREYDYRGSPIRYRVGQPMGAYSSWAMMALTHHYIVQVAALSLPNYLGWFKDYCLLGDDIVIANKVVAMRYLELLQLLGMECSSFKSLHSSNGVAEFVKRLFVQGEEYSPIPLMEAQQGFRYNSLYPAFIETLLRRDFEIPLAGALSPWLSRLSVWPVKPDRLAERSWIMLTSPAGPYARQGRNLTGSMLKKGESPLGDDSAWFRRSAWIGITPEQIRSAAYQERFRYVSKILTQIAKADSALSGQSPDWMEQALRLCQGVPLRSVLTVSEHPYYRVLKDLFEELQAFRSTLHQGLLKADMSASEALTGTYYRIPDFRIEILSGRTRRLTAASMLALKVLTTIRRSPESFSGSGGGLILVG